MKTKHQIYFQNANDMSVVSTESVDLVVTSPPYPMIQMWDDMFIKHNPKIEKALKEKDGKPAFEMMNQELDKIWNEVYRVLKSGGMACINIGDATRSVDGNFGLYSNHARVLTHLQTIGFDTLPVIIWRKPTNAPNKFLGSGTLPVGAYVTLEHEYILILRKGHRRKFEASDEKRRESAIFWEERNTWYSDVWMELRGTRQNLNGKPARNRSGAFPFVIPYRLINMFSIKEDTVLDPFLGMGTTMLAAMATGRNSIGVELESEFKDQILDRLDKIIEFSNQNITDRLKRHIDFINAKPKEKSRFKYENNYYKFPVRTKQETDLFLNPLEGIEKIGENAFEVYYAAKP